MPVLAHRTTGVLAVVLASSLASALTACGSSVKQATASGRGAAGDGPRSEAPEGFWDHWGDGKAELAGYTLRQPRYGELREGQAVLITVTETFTEAQRVKSDGGHDDEFPVVKLNEVREFQTGIYDYDVMTSSFLPLDGRTPRGVPTKVAFSMQEWCGLTHDQLVINGESMERRGHSYFDGEADRTHSLPVAREALFADALPLLVRGLTGELLEPGEAMEVDLLPRLSEVRMAHSDLSWRRATLRRSPESQPVETVLGTVAAHEVVLEDRAGELVYVVESAPPHRILSWRGPGGEEAVLTGVSREPYWQQSGNGEERRLAELGLPQPAWAEAP